MPEPLNVSETARRHEALAASAPHLKLHHADADDGNDDTDVSDTREAQVRLPLNDNSDTEQHSEADHVDETLKATDHAGPIENAEHSEMLQPAEASDRTDADTDASANVPDMHVASYSYDPPAPAVSLTKPLLAIAAGASLLMAGWNYSSLEDARAQLTSMTEAKAAVERSLAEAQGRLAAAEKAVASVNAALSPKSGVEAAKPAAKTAEPAAKTAAPAANAQPK